MKTRDYLFWATLTIASLFIGHRLRMAEHPAAAGVSPPRAGFVDKATYWWAVWRLAHGAPQMPAPFPNVQELPDAVVNAPPKRVVGEDGEPLLDHSAGW